MKKASMSSNFISEQATSYRRLLARLIDLVILSMVVLPISIGIAYPAVKVAGEESSNWLPFIVLFALIVFYETGMVAGVGGTLGKLALGIRVVDVHGEKLGWGASLLRAVLMYLTAIIIVFLIAITASIFGWIFLGGLKNYQRFPHDSAAKSFVVRVKHGEVVRVSPQVNEPPATLQATPLADLERMHQSGMISDEEFENKKKEMGF